MTTRVAVVGASGRVGSAICSHLRSTRDVVEVGRPEGQSLEHVVERAAGDADIVINAAGVAHLDRPTAEDLERLRAGNVDLPLALANAALACAASMIHISSVKAVVDANTEYGRSKFRAESELGSRFGDPFRHAGLGLVVVRPLALLFPPLDAGNVARLRFLRRWPQALTPAVRLPVLAPATFLSAIASIVDDLIVGTRPPGITTREFGRDERGTLRDVRTAMLSADAKERTVACE